MDNFVSWEALKEFGYFVSAVYMIVAFTKELWFIKDIPTKYWSGIVAFLLLVATNLHSGNFMYWDIVVYILSAIAISLSANGLADFNSVKTVTDIEDIKG